MIKFGSHVISLLLFLAIALGAIALAWQPVTIHNTAINIDGTKQDLINSGINGEYAWMGLRGEAWREYPVYNGGLAVIAVVAFTGAGLTASQLYKIDETLDRREG